MVDKGDNPGEEIELTREEYLEQEYGIHVSRTEYPSKTRKDSNYNQGQENANASEEREVSESGLEKRSEPKIELRHIEDLEQSELTQLAREFLPTHYAILNRRKNPDYSSIKRFLKRTREKYSLVVPMKSLSKDKARRLIKSLGYKIIAELEEKDPETLEDLKWEHNHGHFR